MTTTEPTTEMLCANLRLSRDDALNRVHGGVRSLLRRKGTEATLWYKPLWEVRADLRKSRLGAGPKELVAVVDGLTGIARCLRPGSPSVVLDAQPTQGRRLVTPTVDAEQAQEAAQRVIRRNARRRRLLVGQCNMPALYYKPIWLVAQTPGASASYAVDAHSGVLARVLA